MNCPGRHAGTSSPFMEASSSVRVSLVSLRFFRTRKGAVRIGSARCCSIKIQELQARGLEAPHKDLREPLHKVVAHGRIAFALAAQALPVKTHRTHFLESAHVEGPAIRRKQP